MKPARKKKHSQIHICESKSLNFIIRNLQKSTATAILCSKLAESLSESPLGLGVILQMKVFHLRLKTQCSLPDPALFYLIARVNMYLLKAHRLKLNAEAKAVIHRWWKLSVPQSDASYTSLTAYSQYQAPTNSHQSSQAMTASRVSVTLCILAYCPAPVVCVCCWCISQSNTHRRQSKSTPFSAACWFLWTLPCSLVCFRKYSLPLFSTEFLRIQLPNTALIFSMWFRKSFDFAFIFLLKNHLFVSLSCKKFGLTLITLSTIAFQQPTDPSSSSAGIVQLFIFWRS